MMLIYDFDLMMDGGHISGWLLQGETVVQFQKLISEYKSNVIHSGNNEEAPMLFTVGDGNQSLATAKVCWEDLKSQISNKKWNNHPSRYAMVEIESIHDKSK